jgi:probable phosphoglycerate mutase
MSIYLIRHGETAGNHERRIQLPEIPLNESGVEQARRLGARLAEVGITRILSSDYQRAAMTAEAVSRASGVSVEHEPLLRERNFGDDRGRLWSEIPGGLFAADYHPKRGESWSDFHERGVRAWDRVSEIARECQGDLAVVTHGMLIHTFLQRRVTLPREVRYDADGAEIASQVRNTSVTRIESSAPWRVELLACTAHL